MQIDAKGNTNIPSALVYTADSPRTGELIFFFLFRFCCFFLLQLFLKPLERLQKR